jgi:hypothetical protein
LKRYSIVRVGHDYVVQADDHSVLKLSSRRRAAKLVNDAAVLLDRDPAGETSPARDPDPAPDASEAG